MWFEVGTECGLHWQHIVTHIDKADTLACKCKWCSLSWQRHENGCFEVTKYIVSEEYKMAPMGSFQLTDIHASHLYHSSESRSVVVCTSTEHAGPATLPSTGPTISLWTPWSDGGQYHPVSAGMSIPQHYYNLWGYGHYPPGPLPSPFPTCQRYTA